MNSNAHSFTVGQAVHYSFNGDSYSGDVVRVGKLTVYVQTHAPHSELMLFTVRKGGAVRSQGHGTWTLRDGHREERNPSF